MKEIRKIKFKLKNKTLKLWEIINLNTLMNFKFQILNHKMKNFSKFKENLKNIIQKIFNALNKMNLVSAKLSIHKPQ
jgi:hypothetical protein